MSRLGRFFSFKPTAEPERKPRTAGRGFSAIPQPKVDEHTADAAGRVLNDPSFEKVFTHVKQELMQEIADTDDIQELSIPFMALKGWEHMRASLQAMADQRKLHDAQALKRRTTEDADWSTPFAPFD